MPLNCKFRSILGFKLTTPLFHRSSRGSAVSEGAWKLSPDSIFLMVGGQKAKGRPAIGGKKISYRDVTGKYEPVCAWLYPGGWTDLPPSRILP